MRCIRLIGGDAGSACGGLRLGFVSSISARLTPISDPGNNWRNAGGLASTQKSIGSYRSALPGELLLSFEVQRKILRQTLRWLVSQTRQPG